MKRLLLTRPILVLPVLAISAASTIAFEIWGRHVSSAAADESMRALLLSVVVLFAPIRLFGYAALVVSFALLTDRLKPRPGRIVPLWSAWLAVSFALMIACWGLLATGDLTDPGASSNHRMTPESISYFAPDLTMAEIALGREQAKSYTWTKAILFEAAAVFLALTLGAAITALAARARVAPVWSLAVAGYAALIAAYLTAAPWSFVFDFDIFLGDALLGPTFMSLLLSPITAMVGGAVEFEIWVAALAATNLAFVCAWAES